MQNRLQCSIEFSCRPSLAGSLCTSWLATYVGQFEEARTLINTWRTLHPGIPLLAFAAKEPFKHPADLEHLVEGLRKAGLSE